MAAAEDAEVVRERFFERSLDALQAVFAFVAEFLAGRGLAPDLAFDLDLILEELFTDFVKYNRGAHDIAIRLRHEGDAIEVTLTDVGVEPFDITQVPEVDTERYVAEGRVGGLGLHFVRKVADSIDYAYEGRTSRITVRKRVGG